jgi:hypothetical protein
MLEVEDVRRLRLAAHGLSPVLGLGPAGVVDRAVALQGQDLPAVLQAVALRAGTDTDAVRASFDRGELVRSWPMRGTLFATTPGWLAGLLSLTGERVEKDMARRRQQLGLDDAAVERAGAVAREHLADGPVGRAELLALWQAAGIETSGGPGYHLIVLLAVRSLCHWGPFVDGEQCLVATPAAEVADPEQVLADVVAGYVRARGPVTVEDVAWWLKLPKGQVRRALAACDGLVEVEVVGAASGHVVERAQLEALPGLPAPDGVHLLPSFDEYYLGYQDRGLVASPEVQAAVVPGGNGVFRPLVVVDGCVVATWRRGRAGGELSSPVEALPKGRLAEVERALAAVR